MFINFELTLNIYLNDKTSKSTEDLILELLNYFLLFFLLRLY